MQLDEHIEGAKSIGIAGHVNPDGDSVGSTLAVYNYIRTYYPEISVDIYLEQIPKIFAFLQNSADIRLPGSKTEDYDLFIVLDCADLARIGKCADNFKRAKKTLCIDHHVSNQAFADENLIVPDASSASELVYTVLDEERITKEIAECIYTGIIHDTGVFQYSCTSKSTMDIAGRLMEKGINYSEIVDKTFYEKLFKQNKILGQALLNSRLYEKERCVATVLTKEEMKQYDISQRHLEGIVSQLRYTKEAEVAIFLYELEPGIYKASTRCKGDEVDLSVIAVKFHGGGHKKAAGFSVKCKDPWEAVDWIIAEVVKQY